MEHLDSCPPGPPFDHEQSLQSQSGLSEPEKSNP